MKLLLQEIKQCTLCSSSLEFGVNPVVAAHPKSQIAIIGQAPGSAVHKSGIPWDDKSGERLRSWLDVDATSFYNPELFALIPMGFCYPGKGKSGDLPPRKECAPAWHTQLFSHMPQIELVLLIGSYAQQHYLEEKNKKTLTETVQNYAQYLPNHLPLPHPSPRNNIWLKKNNWFEKEVLPELRTRVFTIMNNSGSNLP